MSLLMDALKKAEESKRLASENNAPANASDTPGSALSTTAHAANPVASGQATPPHSRLPDLSLHIDAVDADLAAVSTETPARRREPAAHSGPPADNDRETIERSAVRNVFAVKQTPRSGTGIWLFLGLGAIFALGIGAYFWWQLQSVAVGPLARPVQAPTQAPTQALAPAQSPASAVPIQALSGSAPVMAETPRPAPQMPARAPASALRPATEPATIEPRSVRSPRSSPGAAEAASTAPLRLSRTQPKANLELERGYAALQAGRLDAAQRDYEEVLRGDAKSTDALLGLATIAARQGQTERAQAFYLRALESDPNDATAQAGLINARGQADSGHSESRLKSALAGQPDSSVLHFALGNVYARQLRWSEAQQAYFRAYSIDPDNADYIFNLAVSLDHLHQNKLAVQYYQMALNAADASSPAFDRNQVKVRLLDLRP